MSSISSPFGLKPAWHPSGIIRQSQIRALENSALSIFQYDPVGIGAGGGLAPVTATAVITTGGIVGCFLGIEYTDTQGKRVLSNRWIASTPVHATAPDICIYYTSDPEIVYEIQADGVVTQTMFNETFNWSAPSSGSTTTGVSNCTLAVAGAANGGLVMVGLNPGPNNALSDAFPIVQVKIRKYNFAPLPATTV